MNTVPPDGERHPFEEDPFLNEPLFGYGPQDDGTALIPAEPEPVPEAFGPPPPGQTEYVEVHEEADYGAPPPPDRTGCAPLVLLLIVLAVLALLVLGIFIYRLHGHGNASSSDPLETASRFLADVKDKNCGAARELMTDDPDDQLRHTCDSDQLDDVVFDQLVVIDRNDAIARVSFRVKSSASSYIMTMRLVMRDGKWLVEDLVD